MCINNLVRPNSDSDQSAQIMAKEGIRHSFPNMRKHKIKSIRIAITSLDVHALIELKTYFLCKINWINEKACAIQSVVCSHQEFYTEHLKCSVTFCRRYKYTITRLLMQFIYFSAFFIETRSQQMRDTIVSKTPFTTCHKQAKFCNSYLNPFFQTNLTLNISLNKPDSSWNQPRFFSISFLNDLSLDNFNIYEYYLGAVSR